MYQFKRLMPNQPTNQEAFIALYDEGLAVEQIPSKAYTYACKQWSEIHHTLPPYNSGYSSFRITLWKKLKKK